jgi:hypothetical protein
MQKFLSQFEKSGFDFEAFVRGYVVAALWSSGGPDEEPHACENLSDIFSVDDISPECMESMRKDCLGFVQANLSDLMAYVQACLEGDRIGYDGTDGEPEDWAGHDYWLTRNGHGAGFWDRGLGPLGERLSKAAEVYGSVDLYPGDDGKIYC